MLAALSGNWSIGKNHLKLFNIYINGHAMDSKVNNVRGWKFVEYHPLHTRRYNSLNDCVS